ncbi:MAG: hypothetical protein ACXADH_00155 [Candidatus Kariarchaeaceae archaeon]|jgi:hypothetical protein
MSSVLYTFDSEEARDKFMQSVDQGQDLSVVKEIIKDPALEHELSNKCAVFVAGQKIIEGDYQDMNIRFGQECGVHSASVVLKQFKNGEWSEIKARRLQAQ